MSVPVTSNEIDRHLNINYAAFQTPTNKSGRIEIDFDKMGEWCGIKPEDEATTNWMRDKNLPAVKVEELLKSSISLNESKFKENPSLTFTFKAAVQIVVNAINDKAAKHNIKNGEFDPFDFAGDNMESQLLLALTNVMTERPDLIPSPPNYGGLVRSARKDSVDFWMGAILRMLHEQKHISNYGQNSLHYWIQL